MSDIGLGWTDHEPHPAVNDSRRIYTMQATAVALDQITDFARRVRAVSRNAVRVRRLCDEVLLRRPSTVTPGDGNNHGPTRNTA